MASISIIVPIFNGLRYFPHFLKSLAEAAPRHSQIIFVDDSSTEPVLDAVPDDFPFSSVTKLRNERNLGYSATVNRGFAEATGDIIIQLNTDLVLDQRCIEAMVDLIEHTVKPGIVGSKHLFPTTGLLRHIGMAFGKHSLRKVFVGLPADHPLCSKTRRLQIMNGATVAMTRQCLEEIGPLDERYYNTLENLDHCMKAHVCGYANYTCADSIVYHWSGQSGPARFAQTKEGDAIFWADWHSSRAIDLDSFINEALDHILVSNPSLADYPFEPLSLCRSSDESILLDCIEQRWKGSKAKIHYTQVFNSPHKMLWLPMELAYRAITNPSPYIYLVDRISHLSENQLWFEKRHRTVENELVLDTGGAALTTRELVALNGETEA
jgi:GT2 family glycosyltransferase